MLRNDLTRQEAIDLEIALIYAIGRHPYGPLANIVRGGEGLADPTPEFRIKHGKRMREVLEDPEIRAVMSIKAQARDRSGDWELKRRARMGDPDVREKMAAAKRGRPSAKRGRKFPSIRTKEVQGRLGWITDDVTESRVPKTDPIPDGWRRGRLRGVISEETRERMRRVALNRVRLEVE
jgi:hypothetical protein